MTAVRSTPPTLVAEDGSEDQGTTGSGDARHAFPGELGRGGGCGRGGAMVIVVEAGIVANLMVSQDFFGGISLMTWENELKILVGLPWRSSRLCWEVEIFGDDVTMSPNDGRKVLPIFKQLSIATQFFTPEISHPAADRELARQGHM